MSEFKFEYREGDEVECFEGHWTFVEYVDALTTEMVRIKHCGYYTKEPITHIFPVGETLARYNREKAEHEAKQVPELVEGDFKIVGDEVFYTGSYDGIALWGVIVSKEEMSDSAPYGYVPKKVITQCGIHTGEKLRSIANLLDRYEARRK